MWTKILTTYSSSLLCLILESNCVIISIDTPACADPSLEGHFFCRFRYLLSPGMVSNDDTSHHDRSVVGEEIFCSDFAIMYCCISAMS